MWLAVIVAAVPSLVVVLSLFPFAVPASVQQAPSLSPSLFEQYVEFGRTQLRINNNVAFAVGANACLDVIVPNATQFFDRLGVSALPQGDDAHDHSTLASMGDFLAVFARYARGGKAAERFVTSPELFAQLVAAAEPGGRSSVGGNAALMAQGARNKGLKRVLLGGIAGEKLRLLLPRGIDIVGPEGVPDQIHIIVEYAKGQEVLPGFVTPRANRFIVSADYPNARQEGAMAFFAALPGFNPTVVVFSGLHLLDGIALRSERRSMLRKISQLVVRSRSLAAPMHFEFASIGDKTLVGDILSLSVGDFDSIGCNEEELWSLYAATNGTALARSAFSHAPAPRDMEAAIQHVFAHLPARVTRMHFHSLGLHMIALRQRDSDAEQQQAFWRADEEYAAVLTGALMTSIQVCGKHRIGQIAAEQFDQPATLGFVTGAGDALTFAPGARWTTGAVAFFACPVLVCRKPVATVGAGDSISSSALIRSVGYRAEPLGEVREDEL